jgi:hypothetical protein
LSPRPCGKATAQKYLFRGMIALPCSLVASRGGGVRFLSPSRACGVALQAATACTPRKTIRTMQHDTIYSPSSMRQYLATSLLFLGYTRMACAQASLKLFSLHFSNRVRVKGNGILRLIDAILAFVYLCTKRAVLVVVFTPRASEWRKNHRCSCTDTRVTYSDFELLG